VPEWWRFTSTNTPGWGEPPFHGTSFTVLFFWSVFCCMLISSSLLLRGHACSILDEDNFLLKSGC
jgi:hypothetical protein